MDTMMPTSTMLTVQPSIIKTSNYLFKAKPLIAFMLALSWSLAARSQQTLPDLTSSSSDESISALLGQDVFISCVAKNLQNYTLVWRFSNQADAPSALAGNASSLELGSVLTAGRQRVSADERFSVINSHDTWLLKISSVRLSDTGTYTCQTNSVPPVRALRILSVLKPAKSGAELDESSADQAGEDTRRTFDNIEHNFTDCCRAELVGPRCVSLCDLNQLAFWYRKINIVHECYSSLPTITRCAVAGRNVTECCQRRHIPAKCGVMCGQQLAESMSVQDQSYCADYSASIMSCVAEGVESLPGQPELVIVEALSPSQLKVSWQKVTDQSELRKIDGWIINLTKLSSFEDTISAPSRWQQSPADRTNNSAADSTSSRLSSSFSISSSSSAGSTSWSALASLNIVDVMNNSSLAAMGKLLAATNASISLKLDKMASEFTIDNLKPYHVYQIQMFAYNSRGRSQVSEPIRALTLAPESSATASDNDDDAYVEPKLPDTRKCCLERGVTLKRCLDTLCDPVEADRANIADLMICAPWSNTTFGCLSSRVNHTECCRARGVSPFCLSMCAGDVKRVDYRHFRCLAHMSVYTNCILESHGVLPSPPQNFTVGPITHTWAVLNWRPPRRHARSLQGYRIYWRRVEPADATRPSNSSARPLDDAHALDDFLYSSSEAATNPYLLDALEPETVYESYVVAVNKFGQSDSSARFVFQTLADPESLLAAGDQQAGGDLESRLPVNANATTRLAHYNETACCAQGGVHNSCLQLCDYDMRVSDVSSLITTCSQQMPVIMRCMAGSRNSVPCCRARGVSDQCLNVCAGLTEHSPLVTATRCAPDFGQIIRCMDEGSKQIPSAPVDLHTVDIEPDRVSISWQPAQEDSLRSDIEYHVRYQQLQQANADQTHSDELSALIAVVPLHPLEHNLILTTNRTEATLDRLKANSRYSLYVTAENSYGISLPSLVLVVQTPPSNGQPLNMDQYQRRASLGAPHSLEVLRSDTESIMLRWSAPLYISSDAQIKYRVFHKLLQPSSLSAGQSSQPVPVAGGEPTGAPAQQIASNWTVIETSDTNLVLRNLKYSSQYVITVQAFTSQLLGHMSEILLASTAKPVPPTLNQPLVINQPIEGNNITIMCVALGQPTPQISMFINGLLVQKRTQPYVIYYLVNLVRGHLTITCFASNGHGKDYVSVQSRTEISVRFPAKAKVRSAQVRGSWQSNVRLSCEFSGNPQPSIVWTFAPKLNNGTIGLASVITPSQRIATLLESQFENPFTWSHTLTVHNITARDAGYYQCRARNLLTESMDTVRLDVLEPGSSLAPATDMIAENANNEKSSAERLVEQNSDMMDCCRSQNVSTRCLPACTVDGLDVDLAFKTAECQPELDKLMLCAADGSDHRSCCQSRQVPLSCLRWCSGSRLNVPALCFLSSAVDINQCFREGKTLLPGPPTNVRAQLASQSTRFHEEPEAPANTSTIMMGPTMISMFSSSDAKQNSSSSTAAMLLASDHNPTETTTTESSTTADQQEASAEPVVVEWDPPKKNPDLVQYYRVFWRQYGSRELSRSLTNLTWIKLDGLSKGKLYELVVKAANYHGSSVYSEPLKVRPEELSDRASILGLPGFVIFGSASASTGSMLSRITSAICFATILMLSVAGLVVALERRGYLSKFASSKSNTSRLSFANPAYTKDADGSGQEDVTWDQTGHSLDVLSSSSSSSGAESGTSSQQASCITSTNNSEQVGVANLI